MSESALFNSISVLRYLPRPHIIRNRFRPESPSIKRLFNLSVISVKGSKVRNSREPLPHTAIPIYPDIKFWRSFPHPPHWWVSAKTGIDKCLGFSGAYFRASRFPFFIFFLSFLSYTCIESRNLGMAKTVGEF
jgi:hypothetical protein